MFLRILITLFLFSPMLKASSYCAEVFNDSIDRIYALAPNQTAIFRSNKGFLTPTYLKSVRGVMIFDSKFRKVITVSLYSDKEGLHRVSTISPYYEDFAKIILDISQEGEIVRVWPVLPNGIYELVYLQIKQLADPVFNLEKTQKLGYTGLGVPLRFRIKDGLIM